MIKHILKISLIVLFATFISCKKEDNLGQSVESLKLLKVTDWNPTTGAENIILQMSYDKDGHITQVINGGLTYTATNDNTGSLTKLQGTTTGGATITFALSYNSNRQLSKIVYTNSASNASDYTTTLTYNANDKATNVNTEYVNTSIPTSNNNFTWSGNNFTSSTSSPNTYNLSAIVYDDKLNPYTLIGEIYTIFMGVGSPTKNNMVENNLLNGTNSSLQKRVYEYNAYGYATSMKFLSGGNDNRKFYYNK